jgi:prolyl oligopeptidase
MCSLGVPFSTVEPVTDVLHGVPVIDPYRWLEEQNSPETRAWIAAQTAYARIYLDGVPGRARIRERLREFLDVETYGSVLKSGTRYFFRKRVRGQEQACLYMREGPFGEDQLLLDPADRGTGNLTAFRPVLVSPDGRLLLYEIKQGGERTGTFELFDLHTGKTLSDILPRGYLRGIAFANDGESFYYVQELLETQRPYYRAAYQHRLGTSFAEDREIFFAGEGENVRLCLIHDGTHLGFLVYRFHEGTRTSFHIYSLVSGQTRDVLLDADYLFGPRLFHGRIFAITDRDAPNCRIVELRLRDDREPEWIPVVPVSDARIDQWLIADEHMLVSYNTYPKGRISLYSLSGESAGDLAATEDETLRLVGASDSAEIFLESQSFAEPVALFRYSPSSRERTLWARRNSPFDSSACRHCRIHYTSKDQTRIPMFLLGRREVLECGTHPTIMTAYGGYGISMAPQFSVLVAFLIERGCLFALPNIRGGSEFGAAWHRAAMRHNRQTAYDDFLSAAEWLVATGRTTPDKLAIFGGSNSGLLVGAALTQRPDLFRTVLCMVPILDMLRYHLFDNAHIWKEEYGTSEDPEDFAVLRSYSPYHQIASGTSYPATLIVSGDADGSCNPLHARKMTAGLQAANVSGRPILLDYSQFRGHIPVLPLGVRIEALTDRLAFLCDQLGISF